MRKSDPILEGKLNEVLTVTTLRKNKTKRIQQDFQFCPTLTEQHTAHLTDINYLIEKYQPDELAAYIAARGQKRHEVTGHDFSKEPSLQEAKNEVYLAKQRFKELPEDIQIQFKNPLEFYKFIDNPANAEKMIKLGLMTRKQVNEMTETTTENNAAPESKTTTTT